MQTFSYSAKTKGGARWCTPTIQCVLSCPITSRYDINKNNLLMVTHAKILSTTKCMQLEMLTRRLSFARDPVLPPLGDSHQTDVFFPSLAPPTNHTRMRTLGLACETNVHVYTLLLYLSSANKCYMLVISKEAIVCNNRSVRIKCNQKTLQMVVIICLSMA